MGVLRPLVLVLLLLAMWALSNGVYTAAGALIALAGALFFIWTVSYRESVISARSIRREAYRTDKTDDRSGGRDND